MKKIIIILGVLLLPALAIAEEKKVNCSTTLSKLKPKCNFIGSSVKSLKQFSSKHKTIGQTLGIEGGKKKRTKRRKSIKINPKMKGVFTRKAKKNKMSVQKYARYIIKKYKGKTKNKRELKILRQAVFAKTAKKWKKKTKRRR